MTGLRPENVPWGVGGSNRDSSDTDDTDAVEPVCLSPIPAGASSDFGLERCGEELGGS